MPELYRCTFYYFRDNPKYFTYVFKSKDKVTIFFYNFDIISNKIS